MYIKDLIPCLLFGQVAFAGLVPPQRTRPTVSQTDAVAFATAQVAEMTEAAPTMPVLPPLAPISTTPPTATASSSACKPGWIRVSVYKPGHNYPFEQQETECVPMSYDKHPKLKILIDIHPLFKLLEDALKKISKLYDRTSQPPRLPQQFYTETGSPHENTALPPGISQWLSKLSQQDLVRLTKVQDWLARPFFRQKIAHIVESLPPGSDPNEAIQRAFTDPELEADFMNFVKSLPLPPQDVPAAPVAPGSVLGTAESTATATHLTPLLTSNPKLVPESDFATTFQPLMLFTNELLQQTAASKASAPNSQEKGDSPQHGLPIVSNIDLQQVEESAASPVQPEQTGTVMPIILPTEQEQAVTAVPSVTPVEQEQAASTMLTAAPVEQEQAATTILTATPVEQQQTGTSVPAATPVEQDNDGAGAEVSNESSVEEKQSNSEDNDKDVFMLDDFGDIDDANVDVDVPSPTGIPYHNTSTPAPPRLPPPTYFTGAGCKTGATMVTLLGSALLSILI